MKPVNPSPTLLSQDFSDWLLRLLRNHRLPFLASLIWGILAYMFAFTNKLINHDEVSQLFAKGATVSSGRWGLGFLDCIFPNISMPWIYGIITITLMAVSICLILHLYSIRSRVLQVLLAGSIMVFPSLIGLFGYMFTSSSYALSFLLAVLSVWLVCSPCKWMVLPAVCCLIGSVSIYQSYISVAACLLVLVLIQQLLSGEEPLVVFKKGIGFVLFLAGSLGLYYVATELILVMLDVSFNEYAADSISFSISYLLEGVRVAYVNFLRFFSQAYHRLIPTSLSLWMHVALFAAMAVLLLLWAGSRKKPCAGRFALLLVLIGILPLAINCMYLITSEESIHTLVLYGFVSVYLLAGILADHWVSVTAPGQIPELLRRLTLNSAAVVLAVIVIINTYAANTAYLTLHLRYENAYAFYTSLTADLRQNPEFREGTRLAVIGGWQSPDYYKKHMEFTEYMIGVKGFLPSDYSARYFLEYYIGLPIEFAYPEEIEAIRQTEDFANMAVYPYYGSIQSIGDFIVVKLSE